MEGVTIITDLDKASRSMPEGQTLEFNGMRFILHNRIFVDDPRSCRGCFLYKGTDGKTKVGGDSA